MLEAIYKKIFICLVFLILTWSLYRFFYVSYDQLLYPNDLAYERPSSYSIIHAIKSGHKNIYDKNMFSHFPYWFTSYTPFYHYFVAALPQHSENCFFSGRVVSILFFILTAYLLFFSNKNIILFLLSISCFFLFRPIVFEGAYLKNDSMALFFSVWAIIMADKHRVDKISIFLTALFCLLSFVTKQSYISVSITCLIYFCLKSKHKCFYFTFYLMSLFSLFFIFAQIFWGEGFWLSIFFIPKNILNIKYFIIMLKSVFSEPVFVFIFFLCISSFLITIKRQGVVIFKQSPYSLYIIISTFFLLMIY